MGFAHKIYTLLGGKEGSFLQKKWAKHCLKKDYKARQKLLHQYGLEALQAFKDACQECGVEYWIEFGTLLGAVRSGTFIPHDIDIDIGMMKDSYSQEFEDKLISKGFVKDHSFDLLNVKNGQKTTSECTFHYKGLAIDIFFGIRQGESYKIYEYIVGKGCVVSETISYSFDKFEGFSTVKIDGLELSAPANPQKMLEFYYGKNFMKPDPNWNSANWKNDNIVHHPISEITGIFVRTPNAK